MPARTRLAMPSGICEADGRNVGSQVRPNDDRRGRTNRVDGGGRQPRAEPSEHAQQVRSVGIYEQVMAARPSAACRQFRRTRNGPGQSFVEGNVVGFERAAQSLIEADAGVAVASQSLHLRAFGAGEILLVQHDLVSGGCAEGQSFLVRFEGLLLKIARFYGGGIARARLLQARSPRFARPREPG